MKAIKLPEFINVTIENKQYLVRSAAPHFLGEIVMYRTSDEMYQAVGLLNVEHTPYVTLNRKNVAIIFAGAMGRVPLIPNLHQQITEVVKAMADYHLKQISVTDN